MRSNIKTITSITLKTIGRDRNHFSGFTSQFDLPVKRTLIPRLFQNGTVITHHFWEPLRKPTKIKIKAKVWLLSTGIALLGQFPSPEAAPWEGPLHPSLILALSSRTLHWCMLIRSAKGVQFFQIRVLPYLFAWMRQCLPLPTIIIVRSLKESFFLFVIFISFRRKQLLKLWEIQKQSYR